MRALLDTTKRFLILRKPPAHGGWRRCGLRKIEMAVVTGTVSWLFAARAMAQETVVRSFFTKASDFMVAMGPLVTLGCLFWGAANVLRERPAGKQWAAAAIFLALTILRGLLQGWWA